VDYQGPLGNIIYLVTDLQRIEDLGLAWVASDRSAAARGAHFVNKRSQLRASLESDLFEREWDDVPAGDPNRARRMAELLVHDRIPWSAFRFICAQSKTIADAVEPLIAGQPPQPRVLVRSSWYFTVDHDRFQG
jgi:hypothetical protein